MADPKTVGTKAWLLLLLECKKSYSNLIFSFKYCNPSLSRIWPNINTLKCLSKIKIPLSGFIVTQSLQVLKDKPHIFYVFSFNFFLSLCLIFSSLYFLIYFIILSKLCHALSNMVLELYLIFSNGTNKKRGKGHIICVVQPSFGLPF